MNLLSKLNQTCTYWAPSALDTYGKRSYATPQQVHCRWEDKGELFIGRNGQELTSKSKVFFSIPVSIEGYLLLGTSTESDPESLEGSHEIRAVYSTPDLQALQTLYTAML